VNKTALDSHRGVGFDRGQSIPRVRLRRRHRLLT
jgi:hypothetical protein